jgi:hypothetical protein
MHPTQRKRTDPNDRGPPAATRTAAREPASINVLRISQYWRRV